VAGNPARFCKASIEVSGRPGNPSSGEPTPISGERRRAAIVRTGKPVLPAATCSAVPVSSLAEETPFIKFSKVSSLFGPPGAEAGRSGPEAAMLAKKLDAGTTWASMKKYRKKPF
jgi:hypothetical protein